MWASTSEEYSLLEKCPKWTNPLPSDSGRLYGQLLTTFSVNRLAYLNW